MDSRLAPSSQLANPSDLPAHSTTPSSSRSPDRRRLRPARRPPFPARAARATSTQSRPVRPHPLAAGRRLSSSRKTDRLRRFLPCRRHDPQRHLRHQRRNVVQGRNLRRLHARRDHRRRRHAHVVQGPVRRRRDDWRPRLLGQRDAGRRVRHGRRRHAQPRRLDRLLGRHLPGRQRAGTHLQGLGRRHPAYAQVRRPVDDALERGGRKSPRQGVLSLHIYFCRGLMEGRVCARWRCTMILSCTASSRSQASERVSPGLVVEPQNGMDLRRDARTASVRAVEREAPSCKAQGAARAWRLGLSRQHLWPEPARRRWLRGLRGREQCDAGWRASARLATQQMTQSSLMLREYMALSCGGRREGWYGSATPGDGRQAGQVRRTHDRALNLLPVCATLDELIHAVRRVGRVSLRPRSR